MGDLADELALRTAQGAKVLTGQIEAVSDTTVDVNLGGNTHPGRLIAAPGYKPIVGDTVLVLRDGAQISVLGAVSTPLPTEGTVTSTSGSITTVVQVSVAGHGTVELPWLSSYTPAVSDVVTILWRGGRNSGLILGTAGTAAAPPPPPLPPAPPPATPVEGVTTFQAVQVGTYRGGIWRTDDNGDVIQGTTSGYPANEGAWFYGRSPHYSLNGAVVRGIDMWLGRGSGGVFAAQNLHIYRVADDWRPAGALTWGTGPNDRAFAVGQEGWVGLPASLGQELVNNGGSLGVKGEPYMRMYGLSRSGQAGTIRIYWRR